MSPYNPAYLAFGMALAMAAPSFAKTTPDPYVAAQGKALDCVSLSNIRSTNVRDNRTIDFIMNGNKVYRNILPNSCPTLGYERRFLYQTSLSQLCSVDIITVLWNAGADLQRGASCGLGKFQPMEKAAK